MEKLQIKVNLIPENIPNELKKLKQWVLWAYFDDKKAKKPIKIPLQPNGQRAESDNETTWSTFDEVYTALQNHPHGFNGIGFMFKAPYVGFDLDDSLDPETEEIDPTALYILSRLNSYTEISPSGKGFHVIVKINKPLPQNRYKKRGLYECYEEKRFFTFTGNVFKNQREVQWRTDEAYEVVKKIFLKPKANQTIVHQISSGEKLSKEQVYELMKKSKKSHKIQCFLDGNWMMAGNYPSQSEAEFAFLEELAFFTQNNPQLMEEIYRESGMYREKWDRRQNGTYYGQEQIQKIISERISQGKSVYQPKKKITATSQPQNNTVQVQKSLDILCSEVAERLQKDEHNKILKNAHNVLTILESEIFNNTFGYDQFRKREVIFKDLPWRKRLYPHKKFEQWQASDDAQLRHFIRLHFNISNKDMIMDTLTHVFHKNSFHPVKNYIQAVPWDKTERIDTFFIDYLGAEDNIYTRSVSRKWFIAAVKRIFEPGCKFDYMPVLVGEQGIGKSTAIQKLAPNFFNDSLRNFDVKESGEIIQTSWIIEISELAAMKRSEEEEMKGFLSRQVDTYRPAYARTAQDFPRHCVFMGTTNNYEFLRDTTGNRRFLPILVSNKRKYTPWEHLDEMTVHQLWAEAFQYYRKGENIDLDPEIKDIAKKVQLQFTETDEQEGIIIDFLEMMFPTNWDIMKPSERRNYFLDYRDGKIPKERGVISRKDVCIMEIWRECLGNYEQPSRIESRRIKGILSKLGYRPTIPATRRVKHYGVQKTYSK